MGSVILVTGAASGIGRALAIALYRRGDSVVLCDLNEDGLERLATESGFADRDRALLRPLDVRDAAAWDALIAETTARFGRIDVVMNVAGTLSAAWAVDATPEMVHRIFDVNLKGVVFGTNAALRAMVSQGFGQVVNVASIAGLAPVPGLALYSASKFAVRAYSLAVAAEVRDRGVAVTTVCPAVVATPMMDQQIGRAEAELTFSAGKALQPEDVVRAILDRALPQRPLELVLSPPGTAQGTLAKIGNLFPRLLVGSQTRLRQKGRAFQQRLSRS